MKKTNKLISILLVLAMLLSMAPLSLTAFAATPTPYDGVPVTPQKISSSNYAKLGLTDANWSQFNGYYAIRNAKELYGFVAVSRSSSSTNTANAVLLQDIVVNANGGTTYDWTPIQTSNAGKIYDSIFDGNGHYISGLYSTVALTAIDSNNAKFGGFILRLGGTVKNLVIKDSTFAPGTDISTYGGLGAITGYPVGCTIQNCRVENVTLKSINDGGQLGGIAGYGNGNNSTIKNCVSINITFSGGKYTDPIAPKAPYSNCYTSATASHNCSNLSVEHKEVKATCEYPGLSNYKYCLVCNNVTSGTKTETPETHTWKDATCTEPQTCSSCGETQGDALGHTNLRFKIDVSNHRKAEYCCDVCGVVGTVTLSVQSVDYDGNPHGATITYTGDVPEVTVSYRNGDTGVTSTEVPVEAGRYYASVKAGAFNLSGMFLIYKRAIDNITAPTPNTFTYDGEAHALISAGETSIGTMVYSLDGEEYSEEIPQGTNAGDYIVYYKVIGDKNHKNTEPATVTAVIDKKPVTVKVADASKTYGEADPDYFSFSYNLLYSEHKINGQPARTPGENVGVYEIGQGTITQENNPNYDITFVSGKFTIKPDTSGIDTLTVDNVKSSDKAAVEAVKAQIDNAVTDLADDETKAEFQAIADKCVELLAVINNIAEEIKRIVSEVNAYDIDTVTGDDVHDLLGLIDDANALLETDNLTAEEAEALNQAINDIQSLISRYDRVSAQLGSIKDRLNNYDEPTVKSSDKADIEQLIADIKALTDGQNITVEEREYLVNADEICDKLLAKIAETKSEYDRVIALANGYDEATVTSADEDALVQLDTDIFALALTNNVTADEKNSLMLAHSNVFFCIQRITYVSNEIKRIVAELEKYVFGSVKSSDKADVEQLIADIKALLGTQNITADERALLSGADETCTKLIEKIDETVAEISRINDAANAYDEATVTSDDKADIEKLLADIKVLTDGDNITADERNQLNGNEATLNTLLDKINATAEEIARIETAVNSYDEESVKSTDKADLEKLIEDIKALTDATNITKEERTKLGELNEKIDTLIKKIEDTAKEIERIEEAVNGYDEESVKSSDEEAIEQLKEDIKALTDGDNITEEERAALEGNKADADALTDKIDETQAEIERINDAVEAFDIDSVKSPDREAIDQLKEDIEALKSTDNVTEEEIAALEEKLDKADELTDRIDEIEAQLERIEGNENVYNPETVTSDDKVAIEKAIAEIEAVNPDNLTDEQKEEYDEIKAGFEALLEEIAAAGAAVDAAGVELEMFDEKRVTTFWEEEIEALKAKIDELLANDNMGTAEKAKLNEYKAQAEKLIGIINTPKEYFSLRFFYLIWDCLTWKYNGILWLFKQIFAF